MKIIIDTPKWSFTKYKDDGRKDYFLPLPFFVNYGSILGTQGEDGDRLDAIILGKRLKRGTKKEMLKVGVVEFWDNGQKDEKFVFSEKGITLWDKFVIVVFFTIFAMVKRAFNILKGKQGKTSFGKLLTNNLTASSKEI